MSRRTVRTGITTGSIGPRLLQWVIILVLWLAPAVVLAATISVPSSLERRAATPDSLPEAARVGQRTMDYRTSISLIVYSSAPVAAVVNTDGIVTAVASDKVGTTPVSGDLLIRVDGQAVVANVGGVPFYRELHVGDTGDDVAQLNRLLESLGLDNGADDRTFDTETRRGVQTLRTSLGDRRPDGAWRFQSTIFIPEGLGQISQIDLMPGQRVSVGSVVLMGSPVVTGVTLTAQTPDLDLTPLADQPVRVSAGSDSVLLSSLVPSPDEFAALGGLVDRLQPGTPQEKVAGAPSSSGTSVTYSGLTVELAVPVTVAAVPSSAVFSAADGTSCVFLTTGGDSTPQPSRLPRGLPPSTEIGIAYLPAALVGKWVIVDPLRLSPDVRVTCK